MTCPMQGKIRLQMMIISHFWLLKSPKF